MFKRIIIILNLNEVVQIVSFVSFILFIYILHLTFVFCISYETQIAEWKIFRLVSLMNENKIWMFCPKVKRLFNIYCFNGFIGWIVIERKITIWMESVIFCHLIHPHNRTEQLKTQHDIAHDKWPTTKSFKSFVLPLPVGNHSNVIHSSDACSMLIDISSCRERNSGRSLFASFWHLFIFGLFGTVFLWTGSYGDVTIRKKRKKKAHTLKRFETEWKTQKKLMKCVEDIHQSIACHFMVWQGKT